jgi:hypothetical protein
VRRLDAALARGGLAPLSHQEIPFKPNNSLGVATDQSGVEPPHSKEPPAALDESY